MTHTPTPAEIETLRNRPDLDEIALQADQDNDSGHPGDLFRRILDRLSPPAPEVDEATRIWREMNARGHDAVALCDGLGDDCRAGEHDNLPHAPAEIAYLRQVLSELQRLMGV